LSRLSALLTSSQFAAWVSGFCAALVLANLSKGWWWEAGMTAAWAFVGVLVTRRFRRDEAKEAANG